MKRQVVLLRAYTVIQQTVKDAVDAGLNRACAAGVRLRDAEVGLLHEAIAQEVMKALCEVLQFPEETR